MRTQLQQASIVMAPTYGRMMGSASGGDWENYHRADEHTHIKNVFE
jgi:hypothetical protein